MIWPQCPYGFAGRGKSRWACAAFDGNGLRPQRSAAQLASTPPSIWHRLSIDVLKRYSFRIRVQSAYGTWETIVWPACLFDAVAQNILCHAGGWHGVCARLICNKQVEMPFCCILARVYRTAHRRRSFQLCSEVRSASGGLPPYRWQWRPPVPNLPMSLPSIELRLVTWAMPYVLPMKEQSELRHG